MAETLATKLGEITKKFKAVNKEVIAKLAEHGEIVKSSTSVITDEQAAMVVDLLTHSNTFTVEEIEGFKADAIKAAEKRIAEEKAKAEEEAKALEAIVTNLKEQGFKGGRIKIAHCFNENAAKALAELIICEYAKTQIDIYPCRALCSFYAESGGMLVGFEKM